MFLGFSLQHRAFSSTVRPLRKSLRNDVLERVFSSAGFTLVSFARFWQRFTSSKLIGTFQQRDSFVLIVRQITIVQILSYLLAAVNSHSFHRKQVLSRKSCCSCHKLGFKHTNSYRTKQNPAFCFTKMFKHACPFLLKKEKTKQYIHTLIIYIVGGKKHK